MKIIIGGTGLIGSKLVAKLKQQGHEVIAASPKSGVNAVTGEGLAPVLAGADVVVDVANSPSWEPAAVLEFFERSSKNLVAAEAKAGVKHHVALSIVGTDRSPDIAYFRAKLAQETVVKASRSPTRSCVPPSSLNSSAPSAKRVRLAARSSFHRQCFSRSPPTTWSIASRRSRLGDR